MTLEWIEKFSEPDAFQDFLRSNLPQNSLSTRTRYAQTLLRWFYPDGVPGLLGRVWMAYRDRTLAEEVVRFLYLEAEAIPAAVVADALFPIQENAAVPDSYLANFVREGFGEDVPEKTVERLKCNLRKLGFLGGAAQQRNVLRPLLPSATGFLVLLHYRFARKQACAVEFKAVASDPFWKYLGFKSEDRLRAILRESLDLGLIAKYVLADRIESVSLRYSFEEFVSGRMSA